MSEAYQKWVDLDERIEQLPSQFQNYIRYENDECLLREHGVEPETLKGAEKLETGLETREDVLQYCVYHSTAEQLSAVNAHVGKICGALERMVGQNKLSLIDVGVTADNKKRLHALFSREDGELAGWKANVPEDKIDEFVNEAKRIFEHMGFDIKDKRPVQVASTVRQNK